MSLAHKLDHLISDLEKKTARIKSSHEKISERVRRKIQSLENSIRNGKVAGNMDDLQRKLTALKSRYESNELTLEEVEKEVDQIYGDQSQNQTYYFSRQSSKGSHSQDWIDFQENFEMTLEEVEQEIDQFYGNQSKNETFYPTRKSSNSSSSNWYEDSKKKTVKSHFGDTEVYRLRSTDFDEYEGRLTPDEDNEEESQKEAYGYFKQDDFDSHSQQVDIDNYNVDTEVDGWDEVGHWWDQPEEMPDNVEDGIGQPSAGLPGTDNSKSSSKVASSSRKAHYWNISQK